MMKNVKLLFAAFGMMTLMASCASLTPFTEELYEENGWSDDELQRIQFYLSKEIVLYRQKKEADSKISDGKIRMKDGRELEEIIIKKRTPGVFEFKKDDSELFVVSFDVDGRHLTFGSNPKMNGKYTLRAKEWDKRSGRGKVTYGEDEFNVVPGSGYATLMVNLKKMQKVNVKSRKAKGRTVN